MGFIDYSHYGLGTDKIVLSLDRSHIYILSMVMTYLKVTLVILIFYSCLFSFVAQARAGDTAKEFLEDIQIIIDAKAQFNELLKKQEQLDKRLHEKTSSVEPHELRDLYNQLDPIIPKLQHEDRGR